MRMAVITSRVTFRKHPLTSATSAWTPGIEIVTAAQANLSGTSLVYELVQRWKRFFVRRMIGVGYQSCEVYGSILPIEF